MRRAVVLVLVLALATLPVGAPAGADVDPPPELDPCGGSLIHDCVVSVTRNGSPITLPTAFDDEYQFAATSFFGEGPSKYYSFFVRKGGVSPYTLDHADVWQVVLNTGTTYPDETFARGQDVEIVRGGDETAGYTVSFTMRPVELATMDTCSQHGECGDSTGVAEEHWPGYLDGMANQVNYWADPIERLSMIDFDLATNADRVTRPFHLDFDTRAILVSIGNAHFKPGGTEPFIGAAEFRLPFNMLENLYLVDDPPSLTESAFQVGASGGVAPDVDVTVDTDSVHVAITNIHFSSRGIKIKGNTRPRKPRQVKAVRRSAKKGAIRFKPALARGSMVRGYKAVCKRPGHKRSASAKRSPVVLTKLKANKRYECFVRAKSRAGLGAKVSVRMPKAPT